MLLSSPTRVCVVLVLTVALMTAGLGGPAAGQPAADLPPTVSRSLDGLPAQRHGGRVSKAVATPMPFSMVGFEVPHGAELEFRTSADGKGGWGPWTAVEVDEDEGPDRSAAEARNANARMSEPVWVGEAAGLQTRLRGRGAAARPERARVHLIDSSGLGRSWGRRLLDRARAAWRGTPPSAAAVAAQPTIVTRAQWGADERLRRGSPSYASGIKMGIVHHTAGANGYTRAQADDVVRGIYRYHTRSNGWSDIGYNFLVDRFGTIYEGRYGGVTKAVIGAHAGGFNTATFGVSLMGSFDSAKPPRAMKGALRRLLAWKYDIHHVDVLGTTTYTSYGSSKYAAGRTVTLPRLSGHRDVSSTACPGGYVYRMLSNLRLQVANRQGPVIVDPHVSPPVGYVAEGRVVNGPIDLSARLRPEGSWTVRVLDPAGVEVLRRSGSGTTVTARWDPAAVSPGTYRYRITSPDRRRVAGTIAFVPPPIKAWASPRSSVLHDDGMLGRPIKFSGTLYTGANWTLRVLAPGGQLVHQTAGTGSSFATSWSGPGPAWSAGTYTWELTAGDLAPVRGSIQLLQPRTDRTAVGRRRYDAAVEISTKTFAPLGASRVVLTRTNLPELAMAAGPLAGRQGPVLYTGATRMPSETLSEVRRVLRSQGTVYVMGDRSVISDASIAPLSSTYTVKRLASPSPIRVAALAAKVVLRRTGSTQALVVGRGTEGWRQGVAASGHGARIGAPVVLTRRTRLPRMVRRVLRRHGVTRTKVIADRSVVSESVRAALPSARRISGKNVTATAVQVARRLYRRRSASSTDRFVFYNTSRSDGWVRVLAAAPYSARHVAPPLNTAKTSVPRPTRRYLNGLGYSATVMGSGTIVGNTGHVSGLTQDALSGLLQ